MKSSARSVTIEVVATDQVTPRAWHEIWLLTQKFYDTERDYAQRKLQEHQRIVMFRAKNDRALVGVVSVDVFPMTFQDRPLAVIYTSHVLLEEQYRGHNLIQKIGFRTFVETRLRYPLRSIYWFFDTFSYKSYLLLPRNFRDFWPRFENPTPPSEAALMNHLALQIYGEAWQATRGIVLRSGQKSLRPEAAPLTVTTSDTPELKFFAQANPNHAEGDMLVCLCPLTAANWFNAGMRAFKRKRRRL